MNFSKWFDWMKDGAEWRGLRTPTHTYVERLDGRVELYDLEQDRWQKNNLASERNPAAVQKTLAAELLAQQQKRGDALVPCTEWSHWLDEQRRVVRNAFGELSHPESEPDWSLLH